MKLFRKVWAYIRHPRKFLRLAGKTSKLILRSAYTNCDGKTITYGHLVLLVIWITANVVFDLDLKWLSPLGPPARRAGLAAVLNLIMVILGGRTCYIADLFGISLQFYYLLHHWMARVAFLQSLVHAGIRVRQQERWTSVSGIGMAVSISLDSHLHFIGTHITVWSYIHLYQSFLRILCSKKAYCFFHMVSQVAWMRFPGAPARPSLARGIPHSCSYHALYHGNLSPVNAVSLGSFTEGSGGRQ